MNTFVKALQYLVAAGAVVSRISAISLIGAACAAASGLIIDLAAPEFMEPIIGRDVPMWRVAALIGWTAVMAREAFWLQVMWARVSTSIERGERS